MPSTGSCSAGSTRTGARNSTFETHKGGSGHLTVIRDGRRLQPPMHGSNKELGSGVVRKIKKDSDLD